MDKIHGGATCAGGMLYYKSMHHLSSSRTAVRTAVLAALGLLLLAGFGCRPVLDARVKQQAEKTSEWIIDQPTFTSQTTPDGLGRVYLDLRTVPNATVTATLSGPGVMFEAKQTESVDAQGNARFTWETKRLGHYEYTGAIFFNEVNVETFEGSGDLY